MKLGIFLDERPEGGGAYQYSLSLAGALAALDPARYELVYAYTQPGWASVLAGLRGEKLQLEFGAGIKILRKACRLLRLRLAWLWRFLALVHPSLRAMKQEGCMLWFYPGQDMFAYLLPFPAAASVHDLMHRYERQFPEVGAPAEFRWREFHYRQLCRQARILLVDSEVGRKQVLESYGARWAPKVRVLPYTIPTVLASSSARPPAKPLPKRFFFYPAQFWRHKNHALLLEAFARARKDAPDAFLVFSGAPKNAYPEVLEKAEKLGLVDRVAFLGYVDEGELRWLYEHAVALVMPTFFGPTNIPPLEAIALGCPVAVSGIYAMPEQLREAALYFDPRDAADLARVLVRLWTEPHLIRQLQEAGEKRRAELAPDRFNARVGEIVEGC